jgi:hypothetical protein
MRGISRLAEELLVCGGFFSVELVSELVSELLNERVSELVS